MSTDRTASADRAARDVLGPTAWRSVRSSWCDRCSSANPLIKPAGVVAFPGEPSGVKRCEPPVGDAHPSEVREAPQAASSLECPAAPSGVSCVGGVDESPTPDLPASVW